MLTKRIIPCLDIKDGRVVKGTSFVGLKDAGNPLELAELYNLQGADELVFLDIAATLENRGTTIDLVAQLAKKLFIPFTIGGGISSVDHVHALLKAGADKVSINSCALKNPQLVNEASAQFGAQCIVVAIDVKKEGDNWFVFSHGGTKSTGINAIEWAKEVQKRGAGEILLTSMDEDGQKNGYDLAITSKISGALKIPVIASGGGGELRHFKDALGHGKGQGKADAALAASVFHYGKLTIGEVKTYLQQQGLPMRLPV